MIILACATELESRAALNRRSSGRASEPERAEIGGREILACVVGIGPVAAALNIGALLERFPGTKGILNLGICGSFDTGRIPLGTPCAASAEIWPEYGVRRSGPAEEAFTHQMLPDLLLEPANRLDLDPVAAAEAMGFALPAQWPVGPSLTVAGVSGDPERAEELRVRHGADTENMEGFSLALAARRAGIPFLEVRTISNPVGSRDKRQWDFRLALDALRTVLPTLAGVAA
jgi:futalosine hydrolase